jgi:glycosyltransferase involved in cell wall biosynthesis
VQILFVHPNFPAQFGPVARRLARRDGIECVFVSANASGMRDGIRCIPFELRGGATKANHYCSRTFENAVWHAHAVYEACKAAPDLKPDLIVGHSGFGTTVFLPELYDCPIINLFEFFYRGHGSDMDYRPEYPAAELDYLRSRTRNAMIQLDFEACAAGYAPTEWQRDQFPESIRERLTVLHDGIDTALWTRRSVPRRIGDETIPDDVKIVTYVSRGLESMRGFDIFMRVAKRIAAEMPDVLFVVVGSDKTHYGNDKRHIAARSFREHVLDMEMPDLERFRFLGTLEPEQLADVLSLSDLHIYLTVPFVLSWSLLNAMACGCPIVASDTAPVREVITHGETGLLAPFTDVDGLAGHGLDVLRDAERFESMAAAGRALIETRYSLDVVLPQVEVFYASVLNVRQL